MRSCRHGPHGDVRSMYIKHHDGHSVNDFSGPSTLKHVGCIDADRPLKSCYTVGAKGFSGVGSAADVRCAGMSR